MARSLWNGSISFGLVTIPVSLVSATNAATEITFHNLDRHSLTRVREKRVSEATGAEVPWSDVVKGYEYEKDRYVVLEPQEIQAANPKATQTIDIVAVVSRDSLAPLYFDTPYYIVPDKAGRKAYALLREVLQSRHEVAIARVVLRTRQYVAAMYPSGDALVLNLMRYADQIRSTAELGLPSSDHAETGITDKEMALAEQLLSALAEEWKPESYTDTYRHDLLALIKRKVAEGGHLIAPAEAEKPSGAEVIDIMDLLKRSVAAAEAERSTAAADEGRRTASRATRSRKRA